VKLPKLSAKGPCAFHRLRPANAPAASLAAPKPVAPSEDDQRRDAGAASDERVDPSDDRRTSGHVREDQQGKRDSQHHPREDEDDGERRPAGADPFEQAYAELVGRRAAGGLVAHSLQPFGETRVVVSGHLSGSQSASSNEKCRGGTTDETAEQVVEYCANNVGVEDRRRIESMNCETRGFACLERCGTCRSTPFLVVDGEIRRGESHGALVTGVTGRGAVGGTPGSTDGGGGPA